MPDPKLLSSVQDLLGKQVDDEPLLAVCQNNLISLQCSSGSLHQKKWLSAAIRKLEAYLDKVSSALVSLRWRVWHFMNFGPLPIGQESRQDGLLWLEEGCSLLRGPSRVWRPAQTD